MSAEMKAIDNEYERERTPMEEAGLGWKTPYSPVKNGVMVMKSKVCRASCPLPRPGENIQSENSKLVGAQEANEYQ
jgi:hypothetical protein